MYFISTSGQGVMHQQRTSPLAVSSTLLSEATLPTSSRRYRRRSLSRDRRPLWPCPFLAPHFDVPQVLIGAPPPQYVGGEYNARGCKVGGGAGGVVTFWHAP